MRAMPIAATQRCWPNSVRTRVESGARYRMVSAKLDNAAAHLSSRPGTKPMMMRIRPITAPVINSLELITRVKLRSHECGMESTESGGYRRNMSQREFPLTPLVGVGGVVVHENRVLLVQ